MSVLPQLERDLRDAARRRYAAGPASHIDLCCQPVGRRWTRRLRLPILVFGCVLAITTIALAASGVILAGAPVRPEELLNPDIGEGVPAPGASRLLPLRISDPEGGLPWGMRIVRTTRGELCLQVGRVQNGQLGELGIDGAFHDDGRFHPIPADALPKDVFHGQPISASWGAANANTSCHLLGEAFAGEHVDIDRSAAANPTASVRPTSHLRDISYGILGSEAVSVSYGAGAGHASEKVVPGIGAYLVVQRARAGQQIESGYGSLGTQGDLAPVAPLTAILYRLGGKLCQRAASMPPKSPHRNLGDACPQPHFRSSPAPPRDLHQRIDAHLQIKHDRIVAVELSFTAPYTVSSAGSEYVIDRPATLCGPRRNGHQPAGESSGTQWAVGHNVRRGETVARHLSDLEVFLSACARPNARGRLARRQFLRRAATVEVRYQRTGETPVIVGSLTIQAPPGTSPAPRSVASDRRR